ncbi:hypothetical protein AJ85_06880 [Alkalihalobacillus alcalophilus ATCC 27647 = CGMCC 1.3604]|uniref:Putative cysteine ligase BshC n=1 Tax=Alkalihalobacillus alcalophilus ATCC 27647 = CGMCC 1.3604 TaxID=1218173 RepID=A0A094YU56_ALKAL|nr:bacillithiol biosynthesis cysteine-adding enzyme BshC [Alkalihalobacillus alcalophilus]KGA97022.1 hypothetical protein BALCAV_0212725 [Alkalihalobacillus alcalophilus ATCC 27647 = CGMCC 1.3604]MED1563586.1 bacillithiol biosynthesis cysteine-adding enzyme BshC [Alkalihalobacillus alcalophilus]THG91109.1 hypothetical protein AJ85_06880 [Alkalihalobacillus alcalophilus ATCC 27647 = CGMCC 1.3604]
MEVKDLSHSMETGFLKDYMVGAPTVQSFFHYAMNDKQQFERRLADLNERSYEREKLCAYLTAFHKRLECPEKALANIHKLRNKEAVVVVGGQQAGLLTGPMYTFYKALTTIILAKEQEERLGVPVIPVFWIAGEDHDLDEIRFVFQQKKERWKKVLLDSDQEQKSASETILNQQQLSNWLDGIFAELPETEYTKELTAVVNHYAEGSKTYVDFFAKLMSWLFQDYGLVLLDSHAPEIRQIEAGFFAELVQKVDELQIAQQNGAEEFARAGFGYPIETEKENAHLFLDYEGKRCRLDYVNGLFYVRDHGQSYTKEQLLNKIQETPQAFSNNVVTRPLMQEVLLPVLAFVSGPGEIKYWATLRRSFELFDLKMPPVMPRLTVTVVPKMTEKWLKEQSYSVEAFVNGEGAKLREQWLDNCEEVPISEMVANVKAAIEKEHAPLRQLAGQIDYTIGKLADKNLDILNREIEFVEKRMRNHLMKKHSYVLSKFDETNLWLYPLNRPQERVIHPIILLNLVGRAGLCRLIELNMTVDGKHKLVFL